MAPNNVTSDNDADHGTAQRRAGRRMMFVLLAVAAAPIAVGTWLFYLAPPLARTNYGQLIEPTMTAADGVDLRGQPIDLARLHGKWVLSLVTRGECDARCERGLLYMRQLRASQGRDQERIERAWILLDGGSVRNEVRGVYEGVTIIRTTADRMRGFPADVVEHGGIHLIDPQGNVMLRFPDDADPQRMIKDFQRLLRVNAARQ